MRRGRCVVVFTKPARPGRVKTRLIDPLTPQQAARLHAAFLGDLVDRLGRGDFELRLAWALAEGEDPPPSSVPGFRQRGADLGARLHHGLRRMARRFPRVAAVGSDHPELPLETVERAFRALEPKDGRGADVAIGPAADGGYYLIALAAGAVRRELFDGVPWSTDGVLEGTLERCRRLGLAVELLPPGADIDTPGDLDRLAEVLASRPDLDCPRTRALLADWRRPAPLPS